jgi:hypothetical protein
MKKMEAPALFAFPEELEITEIEIINDVFTIAAHCIRKHPCCSLCGTPAERFHGHYIRQIQDLASSQIGSSFHHQMRGRI